MMQSNSDEHGNDSSSNDPKNKPVQRLQVVRPSLPVRQTNPVIAPSPSPCDNVLAFSITPHTDSLPLQLSDLYSPRSFRKNSGLIISFVFHTGLLLILSIFIIKSGLVQPLIELDFSTVPLPEGMLELEVGSSAASGELKLDDTVSDSNDDDAIDLLASTTQSDSESDDPNEIERSRRNDTESLTIGRGDIGKTIGKSGSGSTAHFFGSKVKGNSIVYILDRSGSMARTASSSGGNLTRFEAAKHELLRSVNSLDKDQKFFVMMFSGGSTSMLGDRSETPKPLAATDENKRQFESWLAKTEPLWQGTDPRDSLELAFKINPDSIFLLSDGEFQGKANDAQVGVMPMIRKNNVNEIGINTIAFEDRSSEKNLIDVANLTGGDSRFVSLAEGFDSLLTWNQSSCISSLVQLGRSESSNLRECKRRCVKYAIPLLQNQDPLIRNAAESFLHKSSLNLYEKQIPSVTTAKSNEDLDQIQTDWIELWTRASKINFNNSEQVLLRDFNIRDMTLASLAARPNRNSIFPLRRLLSRDDPLLTEDERLMVLETVVAKFKALSPPSNYNLSSQDTRWISGLLGLAYHPGKWSVRHQLATQQLIPLLDQGSHKESAENALHKLSLDIFRGKIAPVAPDATQDQINEAVIAWQQVWSNANKTVAIDVEKQQQNDREQPDAQEIQPDLGESLRPSLSSQRFARDLRNQLLVGLCTRNDELYFDQLQELCQSDSLNLEQHILVGQTLVEFQIQQGVTPGTHKTLSVILKQIDPTARTYRSKSVRSSAAQHWSSKIDKAIKKRTTEPKRLYRMINRLYANSKNYKKFKAKLITHYPESIYARAIEQDVDVEDLIKKEGGDN